MIGHTVLCTPDLQPARHTTHHPFPLSPCALSPPAAISRLLLPRCSISSGPFSHPMHPARRRVSTAALPAPQLLIARLPSLQTPPRPIAVGLRQAFPGFAPQRLVSSGYQTCCSGPSAVCSVALRSRLNPMRCRGSPEPGARGVTPSVRSKSRDRRKYLLYFVPPLPPLQPHPSPSTGGGARRCSQAPSGWSVTPPGLTTA